MKSKMYPTTTFNLYKVFAIIIINVSEYESKYENNNNNNNDIHFVEYVWAEHTDEHYSLEYIVKQQKKAGSNFC